MERHKEYLQNPTLAIQEEIQENCNYISTAESSLNVHIQRIIGNFKALINYDACMSSFNVEQTTTATNAQTVNVIESPIGECMKETLTSLGAPQCTTLDEIDMSLLGTHVARESNTAQDSTNGTNHVSTILLGIDDAQQSTQHEKRQLNESTDNTTIERIDMTLLEIDDAEQSTEHKKRQLNEPTDNKTIGRIDMTLLGIDDAQESTQHEKRQPNESTDNPTIERIDMTLLGIEDAKESTNGNNNVKIDEIDMSLIRIEDAKESTNGTNNVKIDEIDMSLIGSEDAIESTNGTNNVKINEIDMSLLGSEDAKESPTVSPKDESPTMS
jgi:hypothetical protein